MIDVIFYEAFKEEKAAIKKILPDDISAEFTWKTIQEHDSKEPPAKLISVRTQSCIPKNWAKNINAVLTRSQGYDHLLTFHQEFEANISYGYLNSYCARAVAEQAMLAMMSLLRKLKKQLINFETFNRDGLTGQECRGRNVFVIGVGNVGSEIVDIAKGLRMKVKGFDIHQKLRDLSYVSLKEGIQWAEVVFCALPLTRETEGLLNYEVFQKAKPGLFFINIARGEISPIEDLHKLLEGQILGGVALDVYPQEAVLAQHLRCGETDKSSMDQTILELAKMDQVLFTPHNAFNTQEALEQKASLSVDAVVHYLRNKTFPCSVPCT